MSPKEAEGRLLPILSDYLVSLPFDLKILQEAVADDDLDRRARDLAAGAIVHTLLPQEGEGPLRYVDDVLTVRAALAAIRHHGGEGFEPYRERFAEAYETLERDLALFEAGLGEAWRWLAGKVDSYTKLPYKGRRASQYPDDDESQSFLYEQGLEFETNYDVTEEQVRNRLRRLEQVTEQLNRKRASEAKKIG